MKHPKKGVLRRRFNAARAALDHATRQAGSAAAVQRLVESGRLEGAAIVASYAAFGEELDPITLEALDVAIAYPRVDGERLRFFVSRRADLELGTWNKIPEPIAGREVDPAEIDLFVVPGLAFTPSGVRLGFGGGYYDRALAGRADRAVGIAFDEQIIDELPREPHDVGVRAVFTPTRTFLAEEADP